MIEVIKEKLKLLCQREGLVEFQDNNVASMIERTSIAVNALLIGGEDMDKVVCLTCGMTPKIVMSDGNSKVRLFNIKNVSVISLFNLIKLLQTCSFLHTWFACMDKVIRCTLMRQNRVFISYLHTKLFYVSAM